jgi:hypothetical protein
MAGKKLLERIKNFGNKPTTKSYGSSTTTLRNNPQEGFTDRMLEYLYNNPTALTKQANWIDLYNNWYLMTCYEQNPVVNAVINIKADAWSNMRFKVKVLASDEIIDLKDYDADGGKLKTLLTTPNPLQSGLEWLKNYKINYATFGNSYVYASVPVGAERFFDYKLINVMNNLPNANTETVITGKWLEATTKEEIISKYILTNIDGSRTPLDTNKVWQTNTPNIRLSVNFTEGVSKLVALRSPISNIDAAFETRNVMLHNRGMLGFLSSEKTADGLGSIALDPDEIKINQEALNKYGTLNGQYKHAIVPQPMKFVKTSTSLKELMVFEEVESDAIAVSNAFGVPEDLTRYYIKKGGLAKENNASEKRLYDSTIIPESVDFMLGLNSFLKTEENGIQLLASFDHVAALQTDKKQEAETKKSNQETANSNFMSGLTTYGQYAISCEVDLEDKSLEKLRVWDLSPEQLIAIGVVNTRATNTLNDGTQQN